MWESRISFCLEQYCGELAARGGKTLPRLSLDLKHRVIKSRSPPFTKAPTIHLFNSEISRWLMDDLPASWLVLESDWEELDPLGQKRFKSVGSSWAVLVAQDLQIKAFLLIS